MNSKKPQWNSSNRTQKVYSPRFLGKKISSVTLLAETLGISTEKLVYLAENSSAYYRLKEERVKPDGSARQIFSLKGDIKSVQKAINEKFLKRCHFPWYISGSIKGADYIANASRHTRRATVIKLDVTNFFPSISEKLIEEIWRDFFKFSPEVSEVLRKLCCHQGGLVQGAPVSSYLANLIFWDIEPLFARQFDEEGTLYTRYVDDMILSRANKMTLAEKSSIVKRIKAMLSRKELKAKTRKTKIMDASRPQIVHGLNVNSSRATMPKKARKRIRAAVHELRTEGSSMSKVDFNKNVSKIRGKLFNLQRTHTRLGQKLLETLPRDRLI